VAAKIQLVPEAARFLATAFPQLTNALGTNFPVMGLAYDAGIIESAYWVFKAADYTSGNLTLVIEWYAAATGSAVIWGAAIACTAGSDAQSILTKSIATATTVTTTKSATANGPMTSTITISNLDSIAANDTVWLRIYRDATAGGDTMTGDAILTLAEISYA
jgi:hypothetical protein